MKLKLFALIAIICGSINLNALTQTTVACTTANKPGYGQTLDYVSPTNLSNADQSALNTWSKNNANIKFSSVNCITDQSGAAGLTNQAGHFWVQ